jgi:hypothetical protein
MRPRLTSEAARRRAARERATGLEPDDDAARWLDEHDPPPQQPPSKAKFKSKELHRWRQRQERG